ncbi:hypothetical protein ACFPOH_09005 [Ureibacillus suwonensis]|uniref:Uncharacterized protein n=1 Tax=Ureibacillus suwonensis TaxID=313007 RepID=A0ABW0REM4_9BACL
MEFVRVLARGFGEDGVLLGWRWVFLEGNWLRRAARMGVDGGIGIAKEKVVAVHCTKIRLSHGAGFIVGRKPIA